MDPDLTCLKSRTTASNTPARTADEVLEFSLGDLKHSVLLVFGAHCQPPLLAGHEHGRTIPLGDFLSVSIQAGMSSVAARLRWQLRRAEHSSGLVADDLNSLKLASMLLRAAMGMAASGAIRASAMKPAICSLRSTAGSPKA